MKTFLEISLGNCSPNLCWSLVNILNGDKPLPWRGSLRFGKVVLSQIKWVIKSHEYKKVNINVLNCFSGMAHKLIWKQWSKKSLFINTSPYSRKDLITILESNKSFKRLEECWYYWKHRAFWGDSLKGNILESSFKKKELLSTTLIWSPSPFPPDLRLVLWTMQVGHTAF